MFYYKLIKNKKITSVEAKSVDSLSPNFGKATKVEYDGYLASLPPKPPPVPPRDYGAEIAELRAEINALKKAR